MAPVLALPRAGLEPEPESLGGNSRRSLEWELGCTRLETGGAAVKGKGLHIMER